MEFDPIEPEDLTKIAVQVFRQAFEDYIHLQHPATRIKKYIAEAFISATEMFWNPEYRLDAFLDDNSNPMDLKNFFKLTSDRSNVNINSFIKYLQQQSDLYWRNKYMNTITIPDIMMICSVPYSISHISESSYKIDFPNRILYINKYPEEQHNQDFCCALISIVVHHKNLQISSNDQQILGYSLYEILKLNNSFREIKPKLEQVED